VKTAAVILAGGASRRMGSPKALLAYRGQTFLDRQIELFQPCDRTVVVLGYDAERIRAGVRNSAVFVVNPNPELGQLSSLQCGLRAVGDADAVFFTPVDYPLIDSKTVTRLIEVNAPFVMPRYQGRRGHPVLVGRDMVEDLLACQTNARDVIRAHEPLYLDVDDPGILEDIDDPTAYARLQEVSA
jgi:molybdenum cofactor cytidylyltransferase